MHCRSRKIKVLAFFVYFMVFEFYAHAQQDSVKKTMTIDEINKQKQNPVSSLKSVFLQDVVAPFGTGTANSFSIQPVYPFKLGSWKLVTYTIIPIQYFPPPVAGSTSASGLGNILFNGFFRPNTLSSFVWGFGPALQIPTRTDPGLGSNQLSAGPAVLLYFSGSKASAGLVLQNYWLLGGSDSNKVNSFNAQYIFYYNFPKAWYVESNSTIIANWQSPSNSRWTVPIGGGPGKTFQISKSKFFYSAGIQGFYNAVRPEFVGAWSVIAQFQIIFSSPGG